MKAIVLSAGQGKSRLPHTLHKPKCLVSVGSEPPMLEVQLRALARRGIDHKDSYDDDMKVSIDEDGRLLAIGKTLKPEIVNGESIGMLCFRRSGPGYFRGGVERTMREPEALRAWYLSVVNEIAQDTSVDTASVRGLWWREIDEPTDLEEARRSFPPRDAAVGRPQGLLSRRGLARLVARGRSGAAPGSGPYWPAFPR
jgi:choline kinase